MSTPSSTHRTPATAPQTAQAAGAGATRYESGEVRLFLDVLADGLTSEHREVLLALVRETAGARGTAWPMHASRHVSIGANTYEHSPVGLLVSLLARAQVSGQLPPLTYRAYSDDMRADLQEVAMATPDLGAFRGDCDSRGRVLGTDEALRTALASQDPTRAVEQLAGLPWSTELALDGSAPRTSTPTHDALPSAATTPGSAS